MAPVLDKKLLSSYLELPQPDNKVQCMYVWIDGSLRNLRCKSRTTDRKFVSASDLPRWEFCGSATELDVGDIADVYAQPVALYQDPFRTERNKIVLCETYTRDGIPTFANNRQRLMSTERDINSKRIRLEISQPFCLKWTHGGPLCLTESSSNPLNGDGLFCGKAVAEAHYRACLYAGVNFQSLEPIENSGKWKYSIGNYNSVALGDDIWISRFILKRVAEDFGVTVNFDTTESMTLTLSDKQVSKQEMERIREALSVRFHSKEVLLIPEPHQILLSGINPESDPYSILTKVFEGFKAECEH